MSELSLTAESVEAIAQRVAELVHERTSVADPQQPPGAAPLVDTAEAARRLGVSADYLRDHADELGAIRLGDGPRPRLRWDVERTLEAMAPRPFSREPQPTRKRSRRPSTTTAQLLPIGRQP